MGWFGRIAGCKPPQKEQMLMTRWFSCSTIHSRSHVLLQPFHTSETQPIGWYKAISTSAVCQGASQSPPWGPLSYLAQRRETPKLLYVTPEQCDYYQYCSAQLRQLRQLPNQMLQDVFVLTSLMHATSHKTRCSGQPVCHSLNSSLYFHLTCPQNKIFSVLSCVCNTMVIVE